MLNEASRMISRVMCVSPSHPDPHELFMRIIHEPPNTTHCMVCHNIALSNPEIFVVAQVLKLMNYS